MKAEEAEDHHRPERERVTLKLWLWPVSTQRREGCALFVCVSLSGQVVPSTEEEIYLQSPFAEWIIERGMNGLHYTLFQLQCRMESLLCPTLYKTL